MVVRTIAGCRRFVFYVAWEFGVFLGHESFLHSFCHSFRVVVRKEHGYRLQVLRRSTLSLVGRLRVTYGGRGLVSCGSLFLWFIREVSSS